MKQEFEDFLNKQKQLIKDFGDFSMAQERIMAIISAINK